MRGLKNTVFLIKKYILFPIYFIQNIYNYEKGLTHFFNDNDMERFTLKI